MSETLKKLDSLYRHIEEVQKNGRLLGQKLIEEGNDALAIQLLKNIMIHDQSKFSGIEWEFLFVEPQTEEDKNNLKLAIFNHNTTNPHHPEFWGDIKLMPSVYLAEMVCDICARASEFGTDVRSWIDNSATKKYNFTKHTKVYKEIQYYLNLLLEKPFKNL